MHSFRLFNKEKIPQVSKSAAKKEPTTSRRKQISFISYFFFLKNSSWNLYHSFRSRKETEGWLVQRERNGVKNGQTVFAMRRGPLQWILVGFGGSFGRPAMNWNDMLRFPKHEHRSSAIKSAGVCGICVSISEPFRILVLKGERRLGKSSTG
ncbi:hypothetical protein AVEN_196811-1 [Araneus ventricosus]|uniref:Uncharacterized protein n=1 Tax=Araneus ventricosus TaxID=182803 RepID=A0A4Y2JFV5_ARAVE|nr:hypothetical protein AVEN_196811-1 [Araneus ventricosus]